MEPNQQAIASDLDEQDEQSPWIPRNLMQLFVRPATFFSRTDIELDDGTSLFVTGYIVGIVSAFDRIDRQLLSADLTGSGITSSAAGDWGSFWAIALGSGILGWIFLWWIGGWWFRMRLRWSGAYDPDPRRARVVYFYVLLVEALPALVVALLHTLLYDNYLEAWSAGSLLDVIPMIFLGLSVFVGFSAATTAFDVERTKAVIWFIVLPLAVYIAAIMLIGTFSLL